MKRLSLLIGLTATAIAILAGPAPASAAPLLDLNLRWGPAHLTPGDTGFFILQSKNYGDTPAEGPLTETLQLPPGVTRIPPPPSDEPFQVEGAGWICSGTTTVTCTSSAPINYRTDEGGFFNSGFGEQLYIRVAVDPSAFGTFPISATLAGGGAPNVATDTDEITISPDPAGFGMVPSSYGADLWTGEYPFGERARHAASHPFELRVDFEFNLKHGEEPNIYNPSQATPNAWTAPEGHVRTVESTLARGMVGNPEATPKCRASEFLGEGIEQAATGCPAETQVGIMDLELTDGTFRHGFGIFGPGAFSRVAVYNMVPPKGAPADFAFHAILVDGHVYPSLDPAQGYAIKAESPFISDVSPVRHAKFTMWGVPADPAHDHLRYHTLNENPFPSHVFGGHSSAPIRPLLTLPSECGVERHIDFRADSWGDPGNFTPTLHSDPGMEVSGCDDPRIRFEPEVALQPTSRAAGGPTGLRVDLKVPQRNDTVGNAQELYEQSGSVQSIATPPMKTAVVTMPEGMTISTSAAQGLGSCSPAELGLGTNDPVTCPNNAQFGTLTLHTPILPKDEPMTGRIYVAKQNDNPFHNFLTLYLVIQDPERGLLVKIPGKVDLDPVTGRIKTTFDDLPQFPVSDMELNLKGGVRAALVNPSTCGTKTITAEFTPWSDPSAPVTVDDHYPVTQKADGSPCVNGLGERPFRPQLRADTLSNSAGRFSPFVLRLQRSDDDQEFSRLGVTLPAGLLARISGITECSNAAIAAAAVPGRTGTEEVNAPSCPASSEIGATNVGTGVGQVLTYVPGKAYLAGPYKGAPLSMVVITPILAGPYDLGVIAVRSAIEIDPETARTTVQTDPFPQIFQGIPVRIRDIQMNVNRPQTMLNPTSCNPMKVLAHVTGTGAEVGSIADDTSADVSRRFQAANCGDLPFKPNLSFRLKGGTHRGDYPQLTAVVRARPGDANIARTAVTLPHSEFLAQNHINTVCTRVQFAAKQCPAGSIYGRARAISPLFDEPLEGPVYLRSSDHPLPDLVASLDGQIQVNLVGRIDSINGGIRNTFDVIPDAPVTKFTLSMRAGKKSLLVNSRNLCKSRSRASVKLVAQNGKRANSNPVVINSCPKASKRSRHR
jgi:hypothetical protein